ncbi:hypothetical protein BDY21DRAFT_357902 [Lineolata rhizophorae]|uniref:t-SNARE coiled-coil homology domain-containing protein n=1 Tax=Lineolata rhizophorae TaxID=578093 RepID=A0A6A6NMI7_9PEZI|nr:hypothetical protein BDY21DRAFT_357902 [Lineolata rhizophorae]
MAAPDAYARPDFAILNRATRDIGTELSKLANLPVIDEGGRILESIQQLTQAVAQLSGRIDALSNNVDQKINTLSVSVDQRFEALNQKIDQMDQRNRRMLKALRVQSTQDILLAFCTLTCRATQRLQQQSPHLERDRTAPRYQPYAPTHTVDERAYSWLPPEGRQYHVHEQRRYRSRPKSTRAAHRSDPPRKAGTTEELHRVA